MDDHATCLCSSIQALATHYDESRAMELIHALNSHLGDLRRLLAHSKTLSRGVHYQVTPRNQRTDKVLFVDSVDQAPVDQLCEKFSDDIDGFWTASDNQAHMELRRRLGCVIIFLRFRLNGQMSMPSRIAEIFHGQHNFVEVRNSGRKYLQIARKLGGLGAIFWLPLGVPPST